MFSGLNRNEERRIVAIELLKRDDAAGDRALSEFAWMASKVMGGVFYNNI